MATYLEQDSLLGREFDMHDFDGGAGIRTVRVISIGEDEWFGTRVVRVVGNGTAASIPWAMFTQLVENDVLVPR